MARKAKHAPVVEPESQETQKRCPTCAKNSLNDRFCHVLKDRIGMAQDCFAWTDDPFWEAAVKQAVRDYGGK